MGIFGWSLPPGCGSLPGEEDDGPCEVCGRFIHICVCLPCKVCEETGNPSCYEFTQEGHWQEKTEIQKLSLELSEHIWRIEGKLNNLSEKIIDAQSILYLEDDGIDDRAAIERLKKLFNIKT